MPLQPPQGTAGPAAGGKLAAKVGGPKNLALLGAAGTVVVVGLIAMRKNSTSTTAATDPSADPSTYDSSTYDAWNQWQSQYEDLQQQISSIQAGQTTATGPGTTPTTPLTPTPLPMPIPRPPVPTPAPGGKAPAPTPKATTSTYVVKKGDTLSSIAKKSGISMATLKKLNPVYWTNPKYKNGNLIWSGDKVVI